jgi:hypothetical protein
MSFVSLRMNKSPFMTMAMAAPVPLLGLYGLRAAQSDSRTAIIVFERVLPALKRSFAAVWGRFKARLAGKSFPAVVTSRRVIKTAWMAAAAPLITPDHAPVLTPVSQQKSTEDVGCNTAKKPFGAAIVLPDLTALTALNTSMDDYAQWLLASTECPSPRETPTHSAILGESVTATGLSQHSTSADPPVQASVKITATGLSHSTSDDPPVAPLSVTATGLSHSTSADPPVQASVKITATGPSHSTSADPRVASLSVTATGLSHSTSADPPVQASVKITATGPSHSTSADPRVASLSVTATGLSHSTSADPPVQALVQNAAEMNSGPPPKKKLWWADECETAEDRALYDAVKIARHSLRVCDTKRSSAPPKKKLWWADICETADDRALYEEVNITRHSLCGDATKKDRAPMAIKVVEPPTKVAKKRLWWADECETDQDRALYASVQITHHRLPYYANQEREETKMAEAAVNVVSAPPKIAKRLWWADACETEQDRTLYKSVRITHHRLHSATTQEERAQQGVQKTRGMSPTTTLDVIVEDKENTEDDVEAHKELDPSADDHPRSSRRALRVCPARQSGH